MPVTGLCNAVETNPPGFTARWLTRAAPQLDGYSFDIGNAPSKTLTNAKNYFFSRYGIPAITYEIGDELDREAIYEYTPVFAEEMMKVMLEAE